MAGLTVGFWSVKTRADLPSPLIKGRAYFIEDEGGIVIDHGTGPVEYGNMKTGAEAVQAAKTELLAAIAAAKAELEAALGLKADKTELPEIVNDLTTGGANKALSAEQGKVLKEILTWKENP